MATFNYCQDCEIEFKVHHEADHAYFPIQYCPFCGTELDTEEQYTYNANEDE